MRDEKVFHVAVPSDAGTLCTRSFEGSLERSKELLCRGHKRVYICRVEKVVEPAEAPLSIRDFNPCPDA